MGRFLVFHAGDEILKVNDIWYYLTHNAVEKSILENAQDEIDMMKLLLSTRHSLQEGKKERLLDLVIANRYRGATEPRDRFYANIGLADDVPPDFVQYDLELGECFVHISIKMIEQSHTLEAIRYAPVGIDTNRSPFIGGAQLNIQETGDNPLKMKHLPSWCPNWTRPLGPESTWGRTYPGRFSSGGPTTSRVAFQPPGLLDVSGILCDTFVQVGETPGPSCFMGNWYDLIANNRSLHFAKCSYCKQGMYEP